MGCGVIKQACTIRLGGWKRRWFTPVVSPRLDKHNWAPPLLPPSLPGSLQVLYPTLTDYDIRFYVMEILKVTRFPLFVD